ncbi:HPr family phosphocarrier protein [Verticiella sediminum]|uniref:HPr family phosphocarrier protein n=1 Tax=Verticiella sediminum TaxID=1247510 RepID=A0A556B0G6_9BURK|nr:HPr family phosphocarrier protein [Verticiella sediminum]TSH98687.1 HPr family phosphocarrier protein [Verticiella sediminum]
MVPSTEPSTEGASHTLDIVVSNKLGLHARASAKLTQLASRFDSEIFISRNNKRVNAKSIMGVMMLAAGKGTTVTVDAVGPDAEQALAQIKTLFNERFGEAE